MNGYTTRVYAPEKVTESVLKEAWRLLVSTYSKEQVTGFREGLVGSNNYLFLIGDTIIVARGGHPSDGTGVRISLFSRNMASLESLVKKLGLPKDKT